jgi:hypothetical protein
VDFVDEPSKGSPRRAEPADNFEIRYRVERD